MQQINIPRSERNVIAQNKYYHYTNIFFLKCSLLLSKIHMSFITLEISPNGNENQMI